MRERERAVRRESVLFLGVHLAECARMAVGHEDRVVAEAFGVPRGGKNQLAVDPALENLDPPVGPGERQRADEMRPPGLRRAGPRGVPSRSAPWRRRSPRLRPPSARNGCRARRRAPSTQRPELSASAARRTRRAAARAFKTALSRNVRAGFFRLGQAEGGGADRVDADKGARSSRISRSLPALCVAATSRRRKAADRRSAALRSSFARRSCSAGRRPAEHRARGR